MLVERTRRCSQCGSTKPASEFYSDVTTDDLLSAYCRPCHKGRVACRRRRLASRNAADLAVEQKCSRCDVVKPSAAFHRSVWELSGLAYVCKECLQQPRGPELAPDEKRCAICSEVKGRNEFRASKANAGGLATRCRSCEAIARIAYKHGVDLTAAKDMRERAACEICGRALCEKTRCIDHCHLTLKVRGVLCSNCNCMLGMSKDDPECLEAGAEYLRKALPKTAEQKTT